MIPDPGGIASAADREHRKVLYGLQIDWPDSGFVETFQQVGAVKVSRAITGDLPAEVRIVEGSSVAQLTADLTVGQWWDNAQHAARYFSRFNSASPFYGQERLSRQVLFYIGFAGAPLLVRRFTGLTTDLSVDSTSRTAQLVALDFRERMRTDVAVPAVAADHGPGSTIKPGLNAQWMADYIYRKNGFGASPLREDTATSQTVVSATMHGSAAPDVGRLLRAGWYDTVSGEHEVCHFTDGVYGYALDGPVMSGSTPQQYNVAEYQFSKPISLPMTQWDYVGGELRLSAVPGALTGSPVIQLLNLYNTRDADIITLEIRDVGGVRKLRLAYSRGTSGAGFTDVDFTATAYIRWMVQNNGTGRALFLWQDGGPGAGNAYGDAGLPVDTGMMDRVRLTACGAVEAFNLLTDSPGGNSVFTTGFNYVAQVDLGRSTNQLVAAVPSEARDSWELLKELAAAEFAWPGFDENTATAFYRTQNWWALPEQQTVTRTITADRDLLTAGYSDGIASVKNQIKVPVKALTITPPQDVWTADVMSLPGKTTVNFFVTFDDPIIELDTTIQNVIGGLPGAGNSRVRANSKSNGAGIDRSINIAASVRTWDAGSALISVRNQHTARVWLVDSNGSPAFTLAGRQIVVNERTSTSAYAEDTASAAPEAFGPRPLTLPDNPWRQDLGFAQEVGRQLLGRLARPVPTITGLRVVGNPLTELGDRVRLIDEEGMALDGDFWVTGCDDEISVDGGYTQAMSVRQAWTVGVWGESSWGDGSVWG